MTADSNAATAADSAFLSEPLADFPGWHSWALSDPTRFNGQVLGDMMVRPPENGLARVRMMPRHHHTNLMDNVHGGTILAFIDVSLFAGSRMFGLIDAGTAVTLDLSVQFIGGSRADHWLDADVELIKETRRLVFLRGKVLQDEECVAAFSGTIRKPTRR